WSGSPSSRRGPGARNRRPVTARGCGGWPRGWGWRRTPRSSLAPWCGTCMAPSPSGPTPCSPSRSWGWWSGSCERSWNRGRIGRAAIVLAGLVALQVALGVEAWLRRFGAGVPVDELTPNAASDLVRSAHFLVGALFFATTVAANLLLWRPGVAPSPVAAGEAALASGGRFTARGGGTLWKLASSPLNLPSPGR